MANKLFVLRVDLSSLTDDDKDLIGKIAQNTLNNGDDLTFLVDNYTFDIYSKFIKDCSIKIGSVGTVEMKATDKTKDKIDILEFSSGKEVTLIDNLKTYASSLPDQPVAKAPPQPSLEHHNKESSTPKCCLVM